MGIVETVGLFGFVFLPLVMPWRSVRSRNNPARPAAGQLPGPSHLRPYNEGFDRRQFRRKKAIATSGCLSCPAPGMTAASSLPKPRERKYRMAALD